MGMNNIKLKETNNDEENKKPKLPKNEKIQKDHKKKHEDLKGHFPQREWPTGSEKKKGPKI